MNDLLLVSYNLCRIFWENVKGRFQPTHKQIICLKSDICFKFIVSIIVNIGSTNSSNYRCLPADVGRTNINSALLE